MKKRKQLSFDLDTNIAKEMFGEKKYTKAYSDIRRFMEENDWKHIEGSVYMSNESIENTDIFFLISNLKKQYPYITKCVRNMHQADISNIHGLQHYFEYDGTPGNFVQQEHLQEESQQEENQPKEPDSHSD